MTSNYYKKFKYDQIQNDMYKRFRILNSEKFSRIKKNNLVKSNKYQYYPIESDNSKVEGHTIYLVTQEDENYNKDNDKYMKVDSESKENLYINKNRNLLTDNRNLIAQRANEFSIFRKYNYPLNWRSFRNYKNQIRISENKIYDFNQAFNETNNKNIYNNNYNDEENNSKLFNTIQAKHSTTFGNENNEFNNNAIRISAYRKKISSNQGKQKIDNNQVIYISNTNNKTKIGKYNLNQNNKTTKEEILNNEPFFEDKSSNLEETQKAPISKNSSINEYINVENIPNIALNRSLEGERPNRTIIYNSLNNNFLENLNNSKIMEKKFLDGIKNQQRKISLLKAMDRYNRFKFGRKFNLNNNKTAKNENINKKKIAEEKKEIIIKADIKTEDNFDYNKINNLNNDNSKNEKYNEEENKNLDYKENEMENENEFSFNSELRKNDKKNHLEDIAAKDDNKLPEEGEMINNKKEENEKKNLEIKMNDNVNINNDEQNEIDNNNNENEENNNKELSLNNNSNIYENKIGTKKDEQIEEPIKIQKEEKEENEKIIKPEINISIDNKENQNSEKIIPEINISIDNKDINNQNEKSHNKSDSNNNNSSNNIINNSINININNNDSFNKNDIRDKKQYIQINNIKYKNDLKPGYFIRKVVREEHYYIDENGKEKILQVKQEYINNEDKKKMKTKNPHKKRYINMVNKLNLNSTLTKKNQTETNENIRPIKTDKNNNILDNQNNEIDLNAKNEENDKECFSSRLIEDKNESVIIEKKKEPNDPLINDNLSSASGPVIYQKQNSNYNYFKNLENHNYTNINKNIIHKKGYNKDESENNIMNVSNIQTEPNYQKNEYSTITINRSKNLEKKTRLIKPETKKEYLNNLLIISSNTKAKVDNSNNDSDKKEMKNNLNIKTITDNYIKVNKMDKFKNTNNETYHRLTLNNYSLYNNSNIKIGRRRRESSKNHTYHEIDLTTTKNNKLSSNSLSHYFNEGNDELNTSTNTNQISANSNISDRTFIHKYNVNTQKINANSNMNNNNELRTSNRFHRNRNGRELNTSLNKDHHRYYESKSTKKDRNNNLNTYNHYTISKNSDYSDKKEFRNKILDNNIKKKDKEYFYSNYDMDNKNNQTAKKSSRITTYH